MIYGYTTPNQISELKDSITSFLTYCLYNLPYFFLFSFFTNRLLLDYPENI